MTNDSQTSRQPEALGPYEITLRAANGVCYTLDRIDWAAPGAEKMPQREAVVAIALMRYALESLEQGHPTAAAAVGLRR